MGKTQWHVNPETGETNRCTAKYQCEFKDTSPHFDTKKEALAYYESINKTVKTFKKSKKKVNKSRFTPPPPDPLDLEIAADPDYVPEIDENDPSVVNSDVSFQEMFDAGLYDTPPDVGDDKNAPSPEEVDAALKEQDEMMNSNI